MSTERTRQVVADYVAALQRGDLDALSAAFAPQATWTIRGDLPVAGTCTGADEILGGFLAQVTATLDPETPVTQTLHRIIADGDYAVAEWMPPLAAEVETYVQPTVTFVYRPRCRRPRTRLSGTSRSPSAPR
jgi:ketosteroid isomerase-like protein